MEKDDDLELDEFEEGEEEDDGDFDEESEELNKESESPELENIINETSSTPFFRSRSVQEITPSLEPIENLEQGVRFVRMEGGNEEQENTFVYENQKGNNESNYAESDAYQQAGNVNYEAETSGYPKQITGMNQNISSRQSDTFRPSVESGQGTGGSGESMGERRDYESEREKQSRKEAKKW